MLVVISDLHLSDGTTASNVNGKAFDLLGKQILATAQDKQASEIEMVLLGDILDLVRTDYWFDKTLVPSEQERPWYGTLDPETAINSADTTGAHLSKLLARVLARDETQALIRMLKELKGKSSLPLHVTYVIGNHDRMLNNFPALQQQVRNSMLGVSIDFPTRFPFNEDLPGRYRTLARHGHEWDEMCHGYEFYRHVLRPKKKIDRFEERAYRVQGIGEVITAELMSGFLVNLRNQVDDKEFLDQIKELNNLRPITAAFSWLAWLLRKDDISVHAEPIRTSLVTALESLLESPFAKLWDKMKKDFIVQGDITDYFAKFLAFIKVQNSMNFLEHLAPIVDGLLTKFGVSLDTSDGMLLDAAESVTARGEAIHPDVRFTFLGHSHTPRQACFSADPDGKAKIYINTGTFLPLIDRTRDGRGFFTSSRMTYALVFKEDEDLHDRRLDDWPTMDLWNGQRFKHYIKAG